MNKVWYKIVEQENGEIKTLFHSFQKSRTLQTECWLTAEKKMVRDGKGKEYLSGWHVLQTRELCEEYLKRFKNLKTKAIVQCYVRDVRPKKHSRSNVFLADHIYFL